MIKAVCHHLREAILQNMFKVLKLSFHVLLVFCMRHFSFSK